MSVFLLCVMNREQSKEYRRIKMNYDSRHKNDWRKYEDDEPKGKKKKKSKK